MSEGKEIQNWADVHMFEAVPTNTGSEPVEPSVKLISMTPDPLGVIAAAAKMYEGQPVEEGWEGYGYGDGQYPMDIGLAWITDSERLHYFEQFANTRLKAPFEFVSVHFLIEGVTRAFTHQLVRQRTAVYVQESQRFAVKTNGAHEVALPPSLAGVQWPTYEDGSMMGVGGPAFDRLSGEEKMFLIWQEHVEETAEVYNRLVNMGMPAEDARGLLPTNITTRIHYKTDLRNLLEHAGNRLTTQAQFEHRKVWSEMRRAIRDSGVYMADKVAQLLVPICYQTGHCEFKSEFDRFCSIRDRVEAHAAKGEGSELWSDIDPQEWLTDPSAARRATR